MVVCFVCFFFILSLSYPSSIVHCLEIRDADIFACQGKQDFAEANLEYVTQLSSTW